MFEKMGKSKAKREVQALRDLTIQSNEDELLKVALKKAKDRVVVKRHKKVKNLSLWAFILLAGPACLIYMVQE